LIMPHWRVILVNSGSLNEAQLGLILQPRENMPDDEKIDIKSICSTVAAAAHYGMAWPIPVNLIMLSKTDNVLSLTSAKIDRTKCTSLFFDGSKELLFVYEFLFGTREVQQSGDKQPELPMSYWLDLVCRILSDLCQTPVKPEDDLKEVGMTSIQASMLVSIFNWFARDVLPKEITTGHVISARSIKQLLENFLSKKEASLAPQKMLRRRKSCSDLDELLRTPLQGELRRIMPDEARYNISVTGVSCRLPGFCNNLESFHQLMEDKRCALTQRLDWKEVEPAVCQAGFIEDKELFDRSMFGLSLVEVSYMDRQQLSVLEGVYESILDAGDDPKEMAGKKIPIIVAANHADAEIELYQIFDHLPNCPPHIRAYSALSAIPGRVSQLMNFVGPAFCVDAACASSFPAIQHTCMLLRGGECEVGIPAAVNHISCFDVSRSMVPSNMLSPEGKCKTFDSTADGFVRGEGAAAMVLTRATNAKPNSSYGAFRNVVLRHNGHTSHLTFPNQQSQAELIAECIKGAGIGLNEIKYVEAHGTGTKVGDAMEVHALHEVFGNSTSPVVVGSVKANLGHLEACAGMSGVLNVLNVFRVQKAFGNCNLKSLNPEFSRIAANSCLNFPNETVPLNSHRSMSALVSSFGFNGTIGTVCMASPMSQHQKVRTRRFSIAAVFDANYPMPAKEELQSLYQTSGAYRAAADEMAAQKEFADVLMGKGVLASQNRPEDFLNEKRMSLAYQCCVARVWVASGVDPDLVATHGKEAADCIDRIVKGDLTVDALLRCDFKDSGELADVSGCDITVIMTSCDSTNFADCKSLVQGKRPKMKIFAGTGPLPKISREISLVARHSIFALQEVKDAKGTKLAMMKELNANNPQDGPAQAPAKLPPHQAMDKDSALNAVMDILREVDYDEDDGELTSDTLPFEQLDSLQWATFGSLVRQRFGVQKLDVNDTLGKIAEVIVKTSGETDAPKRTVQVEEQIRAMNDCDRASEENTVIALHGIDGDAMFMLYKSLGNRLDGDVCLFAIRLTEETRSSCNNLEDVATNYVDMLNRKFGYSHFNILGHSFGAMLAHKMAEILEIRNQTCTLMLGDFEVAYPPRHFMQHYEAEKFSDRVKMGDWEGEEMEAYKILVRRHMWSHKEDAAYCTKLLKTPSPELKDSRDNELKGFVLTKIRPSKFPIGSWLEMIESFATNMGFSEKIVMNSSAKLEVSSNGKFFDDHAYRPKLLNTTARLFVSDSVEFSCAVEVNSQFYDFLDVVPVPGHQHYNLMESSDIVPSTVKSLLES